MRPMTEAIVALFAFNSEESEEAIDQAYTEVWGPSWAEMFRYEAWADNDQEICAIMVPPLLPLN